METSKKHYYSEQEYLERERTSEEKSEYFKGELYAMAGVNRTHNLIVSNLIGIFWNALKDKPCKVFPSDMRVKTIKSTLYTYPDVQIVCDRENYLDEKKDTLLNPSVIFEVLSESTEKYDRGQKFSFYREIESLQEYILVSSREKKVEIFLRQSDGNWLYSESKQEVSPQVSGKSF